MKAPKKRVAIYTRQSVDKGPNQDLTSCEAQRQAIEAYVQSQKHEGWVALPTRYDDGGFTGANTNRPAFRKLMEDAAAGEFELIAVYKLDRFSRSIVDFTTTWATLREHGIDFVSTTQSFNTASSTGALMVNLLMSFAQFEREQIGERIRDKVQAIRKIGKWGVGTTPHGYKLVQRELLVDEAEARHVREAFQLYLAYAAVSEVVVEFDRRGWRTRSGKKWSRTAMHRLLTTRTYLGEVRHGDDWVEAQHEAIIDRETFERVQKTLEANRVTGGGDVRNKWDMLLRDLLWCGRCGGRMVHTYSTSRMRKHHYYRCLAKHKLDPTGCPGCTVRAHDVEEFVVTKIRAIGKDPDVLRETLGALRQEADARLPELRAELRQIASLGREVATKQTRLVAVLEEGGEASAIRERLGELEEHRRQLDARKAEVDGQIRALLTDIDREDHVRHLLERFDPLWAEMTTRERIQVLKLLISRIEYHEGEGRIDIEFRSCSVASEGVSS